MERDRTKRKQKMYNSGKSEMDYSLEYSKGKKVKIDNNTLQET
jgi:hypothetical protein